VDLVVDLGQGSSPYNYSDMTGAVLGDITAPVGTWSVIQDAGANGAPWGKVTWNSEPEGSVPAGTSIEFAARAADTLADLALQPFTPVSNATLFALSGRFVEVQGSLFANGAGDTPILSDVRVELANQPPDCSAAAASLGQLWPPNHKFHSVAINGIIDPDGDAVAATVTSIHQDEPTSGPGAGPAAPDGSGIGTSIASLRAERNGTGTGRVYHVGFSADDGNGGGCSGVVSVSVPHDMRGATAIDEGPLFDSTV
ncbi:MAG TPA: hypothetical protein VM600_03505, partial [Actinomycetota bacterium]|nr:hypothetical protein [Actinomycetota bacterium]